jgi:hypothetical protein
MRLGRRSLVDAVWLVALLGAGGCGRSNEIPVVPTCPSHTAPDPPPSLEAVGGPAKTALTWTSPTGNAAGVRVLRKLNDPPVSPDDPDAFVVYQGNAKSATDECLTPGVSYEYRAWSYDGCAPPLFSTTSAEARATPQMPGPPPPPSNLAIRSGTRLLRLFWNPPAGICSTSFLVRRSASGYPASPAQGDSVYAGAQTTVADSGLTPTDVYFYSVFTRDRFGQFSQTGAEISGAPDWEYLTFEISELRLVEWFPIQRCSAEDCDFSRHGPDVEMVVELKRNSLLTFWIELITFKAMGTVGDGTCIQKGSTEVVASGNFNGPRGEGWIFDGYPGLAQTTERIHYVDTGPYLDTVEGHSIVLDAKLVGDTDGPDVCSSTEDDTHIHLLRTRPISVRVRR